MVSIDLDADCITKGFLVIDLDVISVLLEN